MTGVQTCALSISIAGLAKGFNNDIGIYIVRYIGMVLMIGGFRWLRASIHNLSPKKAAV